MRPKGLEPARSLRFQPGLWSHSLDAEGLKRLRTWIPRSINPWTIKALCKDYHFGAASIFAPELIQARIRANCSSVKVPIGGIRLAVVTVRRL